MPMHNGCSSTIALSVPLPRPWSNLRPTFEPFDEHPRLCLTVRADGGHLAPFHQDGHVREMKADGMALRMITTAFY
jgi:hypothetical protein